MMMPCNIRYTFPINYLLLHTHLHTSTTHTYLHTPTHMHNTHTSTTHTHTYTHLQHQHTSTTHTPTHAHSHNLLCFNDCVRVNYSLHSHSLGGPITAYPRYLSARAEGGASLPRRTEQLVRVAGSGNVSRLACLRADPGEQCAARHLQINYS